MLCLDTPQMSINLDLIPALIIVGENLQRYSASLAVFT